MKKRLWWLLIGLATAGGTLFVVPGCMKGTIAKPTTHTYTYTLYTPVYQLKASVLAAVNGNAATPIDSLGKIYIKDNFIFLNDVDKGIHVIDNSNPSHPVQTAFLNIPGNQDIAINGSTLYADMYSDLLAIDISDIHHVQIQNMLPDLFTDRSYVNGYAMDSSQVIVSWITKDTTVTVPVNAGGPPYVYDPGGIFFTAATPGASTAGKTGTAGSTAKMVLINNYLYAISERHSLSAIDVSQPSTPRLASSQFAGYDLETIFPFEDKLFLGSDIGTFIFDLSNPALPTSVGNFTHGQACDPVVTDGNYAYITLHAGTYCGGASNELDVVNVKDLSNPVLVKTYPMTSPTGLSKDGNLLFVCDGSSEVKVFNAVDPGNLQLMSRLITTGPYDVIASNKLLIVVATAGLYQYDYANANSIRELSFFPLK